jgi:hypothetical protein
MQLPFTHGEFLGAFAEYNARFWPAAAVIWAATAVVAGWWMTRRRVPARLVLALLAVHWMWSGIAYHFLVFRHINPAAVFFAAAFLFQGALFVRHLLANHPAFTVRADLRGILAAVFVLYGLAYPAIGLPLGLDYPYAPMFGIPCPTTLVTVGWLVAARALPATLTVVPVAWAAIGSTAAFELGIYADLALIPAATVLAVDGIMRWRTEARRAVSGRP